MFNWTNLEGQRIGSYHLEKLLGAGTFGAVFKANEVLRDRFIRSVAIKVFKEQDVFPLDELIATTNLEHPNLIRGYVAREDQVGNTKFKVLYLVMELADGTLNNYRHANSLKSQEIREIAIAVASGLIYLHKQKKVHQDLKPDNILRVKNVWKLSDFGLIRQLGSRSYLATQHPAGTYPYMSPEVFDGIISPAFDVWSLGIILVELTTGKLPYQFNDINHLIKRVMNCELNLPPLPEEFKPIILGCLQQDRTRRWTAQQVLSALQPSVIQYASPPASLFSRLFNSHRSLSSPSRPQLLTLDLPRNIKLEMIKIPAGSFLMGSTETEVKRLNQDVSFLAGWYVWHKGELPQHRVTLQEYYLGKYPVTQEQYQAVMRNNPSNFKDNPKNPVENVNWNDAKTFCRKVYEKTGQKVRLPTEAEWEYGCRAGTQTRYHFGDNDNQLGEYAWFDKNSDAKTHPVGQKKPNNWGLYDMHGNVLEWCEDSWHDDYKEKPEKLKENGNSIWSSSDKSYSVRNGGWLSNPRQCRSARRNGLIADADYDYIGFRLLLPFS
jgi:formylglycine-generating enzyme required for sulfatase activity